MSLSLSHFLMVGQIHLFNLIPHLLDSIQRSEMDSWLDSLV
ncbi:unnamed protein product [Larinioides sclopetarius]|uniref:Uncharacterized protein n=1 Tax=Larinioides sclopetarius TaxID=280406 RepID=A0AAV1YXA1_9ARAC